MLSRVLTFTLPPFKLQGTILPRSLASDLAYAAMHGSVGVRGSYDVSLTGNEATGQLNARGARSA